MLIVVDTPAVKFCCRPDAQLTEGEPTVFNSQTEAASRRFTPRTCSAFLRMRLRNLVALTSARYVLIPLEVHLDTKDNVRTGAMRVLLVDSRTARVTWADDIDAPPDRDPLVVSDAFTPYGFRCLAKVLAAKLADMVVPQ